MTQRQAATLSARIICAWLIYEAFHQLLAAFSAMSLLTSETALGVFRGVQRSHLFNPLYRSEIISLVSFSVDVVLAVIFFRCGPGLLRFLTGDDSDNADSQQS